MKKRNMKNKLFISSIIFIILICINVITNAKYIFEYSFAVANVNIDLSKPVIEVIDIENSNIGYEKYANKTHQIIIKIKVVEKNIDIALDSLDPREIEVRVDQTKQDPIIKVFETGRNNDEIYYDIWIANIQGNGKLSLIIAEGAIRDTKDMKSEKKVIDTQITVDNMAPMVIYNKHIIGENKVEVVLNTLEPIRKIEGWEEYRSSTEFRKIFTSNIAFKLQLTDYAQNSIDVEIVITEAGNIKGNEIIKNSLDSKNLEKNTNKFLKQSKEEFSKQTTEEFSMQTTEEISKQTSEEFLEQILELNLESNSKTKLESNSETRLNSKWVFNSKATQYLPIYKTW